MDRAIALARRALVEGDGPCGSVVVRGGEVLGESGNRVTSDGDPAAHAELLAIRAACRRLGNTNLSGSTLYTTMEPCPMCCGAILGAGIGSLVLGTRLSDFVTRPWGDYSVEALAALAGRPLAVVAGVRHSTCVDLRFEALESVLRESGGSGSGTGGDGSR